MGVIDVERLERENIEKASRRLLKADAGRLCRHLFRPANTQLRVAEHHDAAGPRFNLFRPENCQEFGDQSATSWTLQSDEHES